MAMHGWLDLESCLQVGAFGRPIVGFSSWPPNLQFTILAGNISRVCGEIFFSLFFEAAHREEARVYRCTSGKRSKFLPEAGYAECAPARTGLSYLFVLCCSLLCMGPRPRRNGPTRSSEELLTHHVSCRTREDGAVPHRRRVLCRYAMDYEIL